MKVRHGFVSNSSSSSFIVAFPKGFVATEESVKELLFQGQDRIHYYDYAVGTNQAASIIAADMLNQTPNIDESIVEALSGHLAGAPDYDDFVIREPAKSKWECKIDWDAYNKASDDFRKQALKNLKETFGDVDIYCFEYSDNDGDLYCTLEHGDTFSALLHLRVSNH